MPKLDTLGGSLGPRIAKITADAVLATRLATHPQVARVAVHAANEFLDQVTREIQFNTSSLFAQIADHPESPEWVRRTFGFLARGRGQWSAMLGQTVVGASLGNAIIDLISNETNPVVTGIIASNPNAYLSAADAAAGHMRGIIPDDVAWQEGARRGFSRTRFGWLQRLAMHAPPPAETLDLLNRKVITEGQARAALRDALVHPDWIDRVLRLRKVNLAPVVLADMVVRGILTEVEAVPQAEFSGVNRDDFRNLVEASGQSLDTQSLLTAFRRGFIGRDRLHHGIRTGNLRNEWIDVVEALRYSPMSAGNAIDALVQGHLSDAQARGIAEDNGLLPAHFTPLFETAGNPPGPETAASMWRRGIFSRAQAVQAIRESRLKNKYIDAVLAESERLIPMDNIRMAYRDRVMSAAEATRALQRLGFSAGSAEILLAQASAQRNTDTRDLTVVTIRELYESRALPESEALAMLADLGYDRHEAALQLALSDLRRLRRFTEAAVSRVHTLYVGHKIDRTAAATTLDGLHVPADQRSDLVRLWDLERRANIRPLTPAQVVQAWVRGLFDDARALRELTALGYDREDAEVLLALASSRGR